MPAATAATLGELLRGLRFQAGLSQRALTERAGISVRTLRSLERGQIRRPHADSIRRPAAALDLPEAARTLHRPGRAVTATGLPAARPGPRGRHPGDPDGGAGTGTGDGARGDHGCRGCGQDGPGGALGAPGRSRRWPWGLKAKIGRSRNGCCTSGGVQLLARGILP
ncbi:helix-turn-helix domain-containing protein [Streptomyces sp. yr375]|uniref:helix-turn-helix domain-containing protein n=1 Tax=Streptomyces sp. yr375 TaxID=1761906 RepID=UPI000B86441A|nr:helix-turn-helix domain-containing protein [Streptomyces sp. yr375]